MVDNVDERLEKPPEGLPQSVQSEKTYKTSDPRPHYLELDALRGIAILGVVLLHTTGPWENKIQTPLSVPLLNIDLLGLFKMGGYGVALFFLLSGYLLTWTEGRRASKGNYSLRSYALRRALRLVPAYYAALAISFLAHPKTPTLTDTLTHLTFLHSFVPLPNTAFSDVFWSLTPEVVFYALLPLLILKLRGLYQRLALFGALVMIALAIQVYIHAVMSPEKYLIDYLMGFPLTHLWLFIAGMLLRMLVEHLDKQSPGDYWSTIASLLFVGSLVMLALFPYTPFLRDLPVSYMIADCIVIVFFASALFGSPIFSRILAWRPLAFIGTISYSLFLLHYTVLMLIRRYVFPLVDEPLAQLDGAAVFIAYAAYIGGVLIVAGTLSYLSYRYIESPFLRIKPK